MRRSPAFQSSANADSIGLEPLREIVLELLDLGLRHGADIRLAGIERGVIVVEAILRNGIASGELHALDIHVTTWLLLGMMYPFFYPAHEHELGTPAAAIDLMIDVFFDGAARRD